MIRRLAASLALALACAACLNASEPIPKVVDEYLNALRSGDLRAAYDRTVLEDLLEFNPGSALTFEHFEAYWRSDPLTGFTVTNVAKLEQLSTEAPGERSPFFVVDVELTQESGTRSESLHLEGRVIPKVQLDPDPVLVRLPKGDVRVEVDGVAVAPRRSGRFVPLLMLRGRHVLRVDGDATTIVTDPLTVVSGQGRVVDDPERFAYIALD